MQSSQLINRNSVVCCTHARPDCRRWLDAARYGKLHTMKALMNARSKDKAALVAYSGQGTSYGLMGHTALHWAAAKVTTWLLLTTLLTSKNTLFPFFPQLVCVDGSSRRQNDNYT